MKAKREVIRADDRVKINTCKLIKRVGYPIIWTEIVNEVAKDPRVLRTYELLSRPDANQKALTSKGLGSLFKVKKLPASDPDYADDLYGSDPYYRDFCRLAAKMRVTDVKFGGNLRSIHYYTTVYDGGATAQFDKDERPDYSGQVVRVIGKRVVKTGNRFPPSWGHGSYEDDGWDEPGGLDGEQTHVLLTTEVGEIEQKHVTLVSRGRKSCEFVLKRYVDKLTCPSSVKQCIDKLVDAEYPKDQLKTALYSMIAENRLIINEALQLLPTQRQSAYELSNRFAAL